VKVSVCLTVLNEEKTIKCLIKSLVNQSKKPDEIIVVDGGSTDRTFTILQKLAKENANIKIYQAKTTRSQGRNLAVKKAKNRIIAMTDAGCVADKNWLKQICQPFKNSKVDIVAGFYRMTGDSSLQKSFSAFLGKSESEFNSNFLPSARSLAFRKRIWQRVGGFDENLTDTAEDTVFNYKAIDLKAKYAYAKKSIVFWMMPDSFFDGIKKMFFYAKGDAQSKVFFHPSQSLSSHNIKVLLIFSRYFLALILLLFSLQYLSLRIFLSFLIICYFSYSFVKVFRKTKSFMAGIYGIAIQLFSDFAIMFGFIVGILSLRRIK